MIFSTAPLRTLLIATGMCAALFSCQSKAPQSQRHASEPGASSPELILGPDSAKLGSDSLALPGDAKLSAIRSLVGPLSELSSKQQGLRIRLLNGVTAANLLRVLLSAQEAEVMPILLEGENLAVELLLPDSEHTPALPAFDLFVAADTQTIHVSRALSDLGEESPMAPLAKTGERRELEVLMKQVCRQGACSLVAASMDADFPLSSLEPFLSVLAQVTGGQARLRLLVAGVSQKTHEAPAPKNTEFARSAFSLIEKNRERFVRCQRLANPGSFTRGGTVMIRFVVTPLGLVFEAEAMSEESTVVDPHVESCVVELVKRLKFGKPPSGDEELRYLLRF